jgi:hypothetical protein
MPPYLLYLLQPLNVGVFAPLKQGNGQLIEEKARTSINHINKHDFLATYPCAWITSFKLENIYGAFIAIRLVPFRPEHVLEQLTFNV